MLEEQINTATWEGLGELGGGLPWARGWSTQAPSKGALWTKTCKLRKFVRWRVQGGGSQAQKRKPGWRPNVRSMSEMLRSSKGAIESQHSEGGGRGDTGRRNDGGNKGGEVQTVRTPYLVRTSTLIPSKTGSPSQVSAQASTWANLVFL